MNFATTWIQVGWVGRYPRSRIPGSFAYEVHTVTILGFCSEYRRYSTIPYGMQITSDALSSLSLILLLEWSTDRGGRWKRTRWRRDPVFDGNSLNLHTDGGNRASLDKYRTEQQNENENARIPFLDSPTLAHTAECHSYPLKVGIGGGVAYSKNVSRFRVNQSERSIHHSNRLDEVKNFSPSRKVLSSKLGKWRPNFSGKSIL